MVVVLLLLFLKNLCIFLNKIVLRIYNSYFIHPNSTDILISNSVINNNNQCRNYRSSLSSSGNVSMRARLQEGEGRGKKSTALRKRMLEAQKKDT